MVRCPKCSSGSVKKSSAIYEQGISRSQGRSSGVWFSGRGPGVWTGRSNSERISAVAERNAPSSGLELESATFLGVSIVALMIGFFAADSIGAFFLSMPIALLIAAVFTLWVGTSQQRKDQRAADEARYNRLWYCSKCGNQFEVELDEPQAEAIALSSNSLLKNGLRAEYASRVLVPVQRAKTETGRDSAWLRLISERSNPATGWIFDPCFPTPLDLGVVSRLSYLGLLQYDQENDEFSLTEIGALRFA